MVRETASEIDQSAADWAAKVDRGLSAAEEGEFDDWRSGDVRRAGAYARMRAIALHTERAAALGPTYDPDDFAGSPCDRRLSRRRVLIGSSAAAAAAAGVAFLAMFGGGYFGPGQRYGTRKGEIRQIALEDGSVVTLNTASEIETRFTKFRRDIRLVEGEALFDVAHETRRPFYVTAGPTLVRAVGTSFTVLNIADQPVKVMVREGVVEVTRPAATTKAVRLIANTSAVSLPGVGDGSAPIRMASLPAAELSRELAWRDGRIAFEGETLAQAAAEYARYSDIRIVVDDPALAREEIAGMYQVNDPVGFAKAVALSLDARAQVGSGEVRIER